LPLNFHDELLFPLGFVVSFNIKNQIEFDNYGTQPASPLVLILTDCGHLATFFAINRQSNQSICYDCKKMPFKNYSQPQPPPFTTSKPPNVPTNIQSSTSLLNFNGPNVPPPQQPSKSC